MENHSSGKPASDAIQSILILRTGKALGDAVILTVLIEEARRLFPGRRVEVLLRDALLSWMREGCAADEVLGFTSRFLRRPLVFLKLMRQLRGKKYDLILLADAPHKTSFTSLILGLWCSSGLLVGFETDESRGFLDVPVKPQREVSMRENLLNLLGPFGKVDRTRLPSLRVSEQRMKEGGQILGSLFPGSPKVVLIFAPDHWRKSWPLDEFIRLGNELVADGFKVLLAMGPGDERRDEKNVRKWLAENKGNAAILQPQKIPLFLAVIRSCKVFISNDCGPYHMAVAVGVPTVGIFLTEAARRDFGYQEKERLVTVYQPMISLARRDARETLKRIA